jgi:putative ABC transport system permease protein
VPPGNVPLADVLALAEHPMVAQVIPLSMGDTLRGYRIVGSSEAYLSLYGARVAQGSVWGAPMQAVLGARVAADTGLGVGATFNSSHGLGQGGAEHGELPYRVSGVLAPCACVLDRLVVTATESVWQLHEKGTALSEEDRKLMEAEREVTLALVRYRTPLAAVSFPRHVNSSTPMQAAAPALEVTRLLSMVGVGTQVLQAMAAVLLLTSALGLFIALWSSVREREPDLAMLRMLGASPWRVASLVVCEASWLALMASLMGLALGHGLTSLVGFMLEAQRSVSLSGLVLVPAEALAVLTVWLLALLAAGLPARVAYRVDVSQLLESR